MADDNFRPSRSRDPRAPRSDARGPIDDPLAELARLIGQSDPMDDFGRDARHNPAASPDGPAGGLDWAVDDRYAEPHEPAQGSYQDNYADSYAARSNQRYEPPRLAEPDPSYRSDAFSHDGDYAAQHAGQQPHYRDAQQPPDTVGRLPAFLPHSRASRYGDDQTQDSSDDQAYALEDYEESAPDGRRRGGFVIVAAVLGLAVLGTAGAFAYRAMFGGSMLPSLPPIIRAEDGPNKIVPPTNNSKASTSDQADASAANSDEKLVSREEQPVAMPAPVNPPSRVVSTIPIFSDPNSAQAGFPVSGAPGNPTSAAPAPVPPAPPVAAPAATPAPVPPAAAAAPAPQIASPEPKKVRTIPIRPDQLESTAEATPAPPPPARSAPVPPPRPAPRPLKPAPAAPKVEANAPLSIVPGQGDMQASAPARTRTALAQPTPLALSPAAARETAPAPGGGYAVQVTSQRSEAEAQTAFRALRAKFPNLLGSHEPIIRRADLGDKGVFYRALVGPFASMEQAAAMCSSLKAAGGNCIVQRD